MKRSCLALAILVWALPVGAQTLTPAPMPTVAASDINASDAVGATPGTFTVDKTGGAKYSIPIFAVPGTAGMTPKLSLDYDSNGGNGLFGIGWSIGGLSEITRCHQNKLQDSQNRPITWDANDRFCMDGQRLVPYGPNGALKKEIDDGDIIFPFGGVAGAPEYFRVQHKDGSYSFYGNAPTSRDPNSTSPLANSSPYDGKILANNDASKVYTWKLRKHQDRAGNPIWYQHGFWGGANGGHALVEIRYAYGPNAGPDNYGARIYFTYLGRPDTFDTGYVGGATGLRNGLRVTQITSENGTVVRTYKLSYWESPTSAYKGPSHLNSVQECGLNGTACRPATQFTWQLPSMSFSGRYQISYPTTAPVGAFGDINGDGCMDAIFQTGPGLQYAFGNCQGGGYSLGAFALFTDGNTGEVAGRTPTIAFADLNHDGHADLVLSGVGGSTESLLIYYATPMTDGSWRLAAVPVSVTLGAYTNSSNIYPGYVTEPFLSDINGDGLPDIVVGAFASNSTAFQGIGVLYGIDQSQGSSSAQAYSFGSKQILSDSCGLPAPSSSIGSLTVTNGGDVNGDGLEDIIISDNYPGGGITGIEAIQTTTSGAISLGCWMSNPALFTMSGRDINGDGLTDMAQFKYSLMSWDYGAVQLNSGSALGAALPTVQSSNQGGSVTHVFGDFNGDGYLDIVDENNASVYNVLLWNPTTQSYNTTASTTMGGGLSAWGQYAIDLNGDGAMDVVQSDPWYMTMSNPVTNYELNTGSGRSAITQITDGLGAVTTITYENIQKSTHYQKLSVNPSASTTYPGTFQWNRQSYVKSNATDYYTAMNAGVDIGLDFEQWLGKKEAPISELTGPKWVVTAIDQSSPSVSATSTQLNDAITATRRTSYYYGEGKVENSVRGFLGFQTIKVVDEATGLQTITRYRQDFPFIGKAFAEDVYTSTNQLISSTSQWWAFQDWGTRTQAAPYLVTPEPAIVNKTLFNPDVSGTPIVMSSQITTNTFTATLSKASEQVNTLDATSSSVGSVLTTYTYSTASGDDRDYYGLPSQITVKSSRPSRPDLTRTYALNYYCYDQSPCTSPKGLLYQKIIEPNKSAYKATTTYNYNSMGNDTQESLSGVDIVSRSTSYGYDALGRFRNTTTNGLNQVVSNVVSRNGLGQPTQINGLNGTSVQYGFGAFGRQYLEYHNNGRYKTTSRSFGGAKISDYSVFSGGASQLDWYDIIGRNILKQLSGFDGPSEVDTYYDPAGRVHHVTDPVSGFTSTFYDNVGRVSSIKAPDGAITMMSYNGLAKTTTYPSGQKKVEVNNPLGELSSVTDNLNGVVQYSYDAEGHPLTITTSGPSQATGVPASITVTYAYDDVGRKKTLIDPDKGTWNYTYDVLGELLTQTDAKAQTNTASYDVLGRMLTRTDKTSSGSVEETTTWTYDTATNGVGQLANVQQANSGYTRAYTYDSLGRENGQAVFLIADGILQYDVARYYDQYGREYQTFDASGNGIQRLYNSSGYFYQANDLSSTFAVGDQLYIITDEDAADRITYDSVGVAANVNGVPYITRMSSFDTMGRPTTIHTRLITMTQLTFFPTIVELQNLSYSYYFGCNTAGLCSNQYGNMYQRQDLVRGLTETYSYDGLNRLNSSQVSGQAAVTVNYDSFGNITSKSDQGTYSYGSNAGPHALTSIAGVGSASNTYDPNGNYTGTTTGTPRTVTYNTFDKPLTMTRGNYSSTFTYGPDRDYYKRVDNDNGVTRKTLYLSGVEKIYTPADGSGTRTERRYLPGGAYRISTYNNSNNALLSSSTEILLDDQQGSTDTIVDNNGNLKQAMSFDAWGMRRNPNTWVPLTTAQGFDNSQTSHGYTGHEMVDNLDLVHMHGRIYDARWGRMLQADPYINETPSWMVGVQDLVSSQAQNRYAYVDNNPLIHTDPTGYCTFADVNACVAQGFSATANGVAGFSMGNAALDSGGPSAFGTPIPGGANSAGGQNSISGESKNLAAGMNQGADGALRGLAGKSQIANVTAGKDPADGSAETGCSSTLCRSSNFDSSKSNGQTVRNTPEMDGYMRNGASNVAAGARDTEEKIGFIQGDGSYRRPGDAVAGSDRTADTARATIQPGDISVIHGHLRGESLVDDPRSPHAMGDSQPLSHGLTNGTAVGGKIGVHEIVNGQLQFRMIEGQMSNAERMSIQRNLNTEQREFYKP